MGQSPFKGYEPLFTTPLYYNISKVNGAIKTDGVLSEASWNAAKWSEDFVDIEGDKKPAPTFKTRFKMLWDNSNLYIAAEMEEPHIWSYLSQHDTIVFHDNDFEVFIDPDGNTHNYFEIEVNALKTVFDLFLSKPYRNGGDGLINWNTEDLKLGVTIYGTLNKPTDKDKKWQVEMAIPFRSIGYGYNYKIPANGTIWRMNFSRVEWNTEVKNDKYVKKINPETGKNQPENNWVWSPQGVINMHYPERWGYVQFVTGQPVQTEASFQLPAAEELKKYLWLIYYKQQEELHRSKKYATSLKDLGINDSTIKFANKLYTIQLEATHNLFEATIAESGAQITSKINQNGELKSVVVKEQ